MNQTSNSCCICIFFIISFVMCISILEIETYNNTLYYYKNKTCHINKIEYPTKLPSYNTHYRNSYRENTVENSINLWSKCDCGLRCHGLTSCIKIFVSVENNSYKEYQIQKNTYYAENYGGDKCSLYSNYCALGNTIKYGNSTLEKALDIYNEYINKSIECFHNEGRDVVYLEKHYFDNLMDLIITLSVSLSMMFCLALYRFSILKKILSLCKKEDIQYISPIEKYNTSDTKITIKSSQTIL